jgi:tetratricopeptide (TPR) repeat protein
LGEFLTELRPAVALFMSFEGIDYDGDPDAGLKLDAYIRRVQQIVTRCDGIVSQLVIGDKGSNICAAFGAPVAHEDESQRAVATALALQSPEANADLIHSVRIGISQGTLRTGAYGATTRRIYSILGDEVNLAARLMQHAASGEAIVSRRVQKTVTEDFSWELLPAIQVKGKTQPLAVARLLGQRSALDGELGLLGAVDSPLVGRETELAQLASILERMVAGQGQILRLLGATGIGKSHLAAEFATRATARGVGVHAGVCQSISRHLAYSAVRPIFRALLGLADPPASDQTAPAEPSSTGEGKNGQEYPATATARQITELEALLDRLNPDWHIRLPLLGDLLDLPIPDNATTAAFDPHLRQQALHTLAVDLVQACARDQPLLLLIEDAHWMDEASQELTLALSRTVARSPVLLMVIHRSAAASEELPLPELNRLPGYNQLELGELPANGIAALVSNRLGAPPGGVSSLALSLIQTQAQGNPFFAEEMVDALRETDLLAYVSSGAANQVEGGRAMWALSDDLLDALRAANCLERDPGSGAWVLCPEAQISTAALGLPDSVHRTVLSRLDRLPEPHKLTLKVASVIGRVFELPVVASAHPVKPGQATLQAELETFVRRSFVQPLPASGGTYAFKHNVSQEVVYDTIPWQQQRELHQAVGTALEARQPKGAGRAEAVEQLAYHFGRGGDGARDKAMHYLDLAARKAQRQQANQTALNYYEQALAMEERWPWRQGQAQVLHVLGKRQEEVASLTALQAMPDAPVYDVAHLWGQYHEATSDYAQAQDAVERALAASRQGANLVGEANCLAQLGLIARRRGDYEGAKDWYGQALDLFHGDATLSLEKSLALTPALIGLGIVHRLQGEYGEATTYYERALALSRQSGNRAGEAQALNSLGATAQYQRHFGQALAYYQQAIGIARTIGDRAGEGLAMVNVSQCSMETGDYGQAQVYMGEALSNQQAMGNKWAEVNVWNQLGILYQELGDLPQAHDCLSQGLQLSQEIGDQAGEAYLLANLGLVAHDEGNLQDAESLLLEGLALAETQDDKYLRSIFATYLSSTYLRLGRLALAIEQAQAALALRQATGLHLFSADNLATLGSAYLAKADPDLALDHARQALAILDECDGEGPEFPQQDYFICYQVLQACGQTEAAQDALGSAYRLLMRHAEKIVDPAMRQSFLERVPGNRQIVQEVENGKHRDQRPENA